MVTDMYYLLCNKVLGTRDTEKKKKKSVIPVSRNQVKQTYNNL